MKKICSFWFITLLLLLNGNTEAQTINGFMHSSGGTNFQIKEALPTTMELGFRYYRANEPDIFNKVFGKHDIGGIWKLNSGHAFDTAVARLTNGFDDKFQSSGRVGPGTGFSYKLESQLFSNYPLSGPDLKGLDIVGFEFELLEIKLDIPGSDPNGDGFWVDRGYTFRMGVEIVGAVPIPPTGILFSFALGILGLIKRKRRA